MSHEKIPTPLHTAFIELWNQWRDIGTQHAVSLDPMTEAQLARDWVCSDYVAQTCLRDPALLQGLSSSDDLQRRYAADEYALRLAQQLDGSEDETRLMQELRRFRQREMVRIIWRDFAGLCGLDETLTALSALAEACIDNALRHLYCWQTAVYGTPCDEDGIAQPLVVLGMGKLGGGELNVSSDVDLIFAYPREGQTQGAARDLDNFEFFLRLGQRLIQVLQQPTEHGFVFRVDMRLRPFGDSGPLLMSFDGIENYYTIHGREWERYAMIKARVVAGDQEQGLELLQRLKPFVYRRYLDFGAYESLRELKGMIEKEVARKGMENNIKLGAGGIREIEFIAQVFQLIRGGREPQLQQRRLLPVLEYLRAQQLLPGYVVQQLIEAYTFLRNTEHRIQGYADQQSHSLPEDETARARLAFSMGFADWPSFAAALTKHRHRVQAHFEQVFAAPQSHTGATALNEQVGLLWRAELDHPDKATAILSQLGFSDVAQVQQRLSALKTGRVFLSASSRGQARFERLLPLLIGAALQQEHADRALQRSLEVIEAILRRTAYLALLEEHPMALSQLVQLCAASPWITNYLAAHPILLDELLDPRYLYAPGNKETLLAALKARLSDIDPSDEERILDALRHFKQANVLRVAAADLAGELPLMKVSDHLTWIAETILQGALDWAWQGLAAKHGCPACTDVHGANKGFLILGYGKLGGLELGYGSDLDLVFLYKGQEGDAQTEGSKPLSVAVFYARLAQRLMHILTTLTPAGVLYEIDLRLRPDGAAGLLVSSMTAYAAYQAEKAWTWEHQALARARVVAGDDSLAEQFTALRRSILTRPREQDALRQEVCQMRAKMREALARVESGQFDLKHSPGGIVDIEFMVQYAVLAWAHQYPALLTYTDNIRQLQGLQASGVLQPADTAFLSDSYRAYRGRVHRLKLQEHAAVVAETEFAEQAAGVKQLWNRVMGCSVS